MKRLNPKTRKPFKFGDIREDGYIFSHYNKRLQKDGFFGEQWQSPQAKQNKSKADTKRKRKKSAEAKENPGIKRLNPKTGEEYSLGDKEKGKWFIQYDNAYIKNDGYVRELWGNWDTYHNFKIKSLKVNAHYRAKKEGYKSDLTIEYLHDIFPKDFKCPALGIKMEWGNKKGTRTSPSLDKINPDKGYMKGNVAIISLKANSIKSDATPKEVIKVAKWLEEMS